uniref:Uncharacterized protein n=1 Tax=Arundo donax TaxID=35708 RepID=A0A0A9E8J6_ARUDO
MKLLLRSMEASSMVVGPAPATPPQPPAAAGPWRSGCIARLLWFRRGGAGG